MIKQHAVITISHLQTSEIGITEHVEGDECKFAIWSGSIMPTYNKIVLKVRC
jgi:hypothetical protein